MFKSFAAVAAGAVLLLAATTAGATVARVDPAGEAAPQGTLSLDPDVDSSTSAAFKDVGPQHNALAGPPPANRRGSVPEPAAWALMIVGFGGAGAMLRRRRALAA